MNPVYEIIRAQLSQSVPFAQHTGVELVMLGDGEAEAKLEQNVNTINHIGSQHAGALYTLGETASGAAMAGAFAGELLNVRPVASGATVKYAKVAKGTITAQARTKEKASKLRNDLETDGKAVFEVDVHFRDDRGEEVANMTVGWHVSWKTPKT